MNTLNTFEHRTDDPTHARSSFMNAAVTLEHWVGQHKLMVVEENRRLSEARSLSKVMDMLVYRDSTARQSSADFCALEATYEVLTHAIGDLAELVPGERGRYLVDLVTAQCPDGEVDPFRFRVAHLLATYVSTMPTDTAYGLVRSQADVSLFGWESGHGMSVDLITLRPPENENWFRGEMRTAMEVGQAWSETFEGVRYLPLEDLAAARYYRPDGAWQPLVDPARLTTR